MVRCFIVSMFAFMVMAAGCTRQEKECVAACFITPPEPVCGDDVIQAPETCEGGNISGARCEDFPSYTGGVLDCTEFCELDFSDCIRR